MLPLEATLAIDVPSYCQQKLYPETKTASFFYVGVEKLTLEEIVKSIVGTRADIIPTGDKSIIGEALSPNINVWIISHKNTEENCILMKVDVTTSERHPENALSQEIHLDENTFVFVNSPSKDEIAETVSHYLETVIEKILNSSSIKPKFYILTAHLNMLKLLESFNEDESLTKHPVKIGDTPLLH